jgi:hypothetical protein
LTTADNTDPNDGCSYNKVDQVFANVSPSCWQATVIRMVIQMEQIQIQSSYGQNDVLTAHLGQQVR